MIKKKKFDLGVLIIPKANELFFNKFIRWILEQREFFYKFMNIFFNLV